MTLRIDLDRPDTYFPGEKLSGKVVVSLQEDSYTYECIVVTFTGEGKVSWTDHVYVPNICTQCSKNKTDASRSCSKYSSSSTYCTTCKSYNGRGKYVTVYQRGRENYLNLSKVLEGKEGTGDILELSEGISSFPFEITLPANIPPSLELSGAYIRYNIDARVKRVWYKWDLVSSLSFNVKGHINLNSELGVRNSVTRTDIRTISLSSCCCPWLLSFAFPVDTESGDVTYKLKILRTGFIPGESIPFTLDLSNSTNTNVPSSTISLIQTIKYFAQGATKSVDITLASSTVNGVSPGENKRWESPESYNSLSVPNPCLLSRLDGCHIISISYAVKVISHTNSHESFQFTIYCQVELEVRISGIFLSNLSTTVPIMIGSVSLSN